MLFSNTPVAAVSVRSPVNDERRKVACAFCQTFLRSDHVPAYAWDLSIVTASDFMIVPAKGALLPGWVLVVGKQHVLCGGALDQEKLEQLRCGIEMARYLVEHRFGPATVFENGPPAPHSELGCGIDHVHFHVVPLGFSLTSYALQMYPELRWRRSTSIDDLRALHSRGQAYVYVEEPGQRPVHAVLRRPVSQLLRRVIATATGQANMWDYAQHHFVRNAELTLQNLMSTVPKVAC